MGPIIAVAVGVLAVLWVTGWLTPKRLRWIAAATSGLVGLRVVAMGQPLVGAALFGLAAWLALRGKAAPARMDVEAARTLLGVGPGASEAEIIAAHRRLITEVHPDRGGSTEASSEANAARDILLQQLRVSRR